MEYQESKQCHECPLVWTYFCQHCCKSLCENHFKLHTIQKTCRVCQEIKCNAHMATVNLCDTCWIIEENQILNTNKCRSFQYTGRGYFSLNYIKPA
jgi:hypothetical protein